MTDDRELLEKAAKAAGEEMIRYDDLLGAILRGVQDPWNPLESDADALRLAVKLGMMDEGTRAHTNLMWELAESREPDPYAATRRAIVRAAASLAKDERSET